MLVELIRAYTPDDFGHEEPCGICEHAFRVESVLAHITSDVGGADLGFACPACIEALNGRNDRLFPSLEEYETALRRYPEPMFASLEELEKAERAAGGVHAFYGRNAIPRALAD